MIAAGPAPRPRLDLVSPLPPVRSGIADYTADLLPHLAELAEVRLVRLPGQPVAAELAAAWPLAGAEAVGEEPGRLPLYQMGNNRHHEGVQELALRHPGVLTLHDVVLHHLLLDVTLGRGDFYGYRDRLSRDHGWIGEATAVAKRWGAYGTAPIFALPAHRTLLRRQRGVLVHSEWAAAVVREEDPGLPRVRAVPMGVPLPPPADREAGLALRRRLGLPEDAPVVGSFGFQTPIKRTGLVIRALAAPGLERLHLLIVGEEAPGTGLLEAAHEAGVAARVRILGYLPFAGFAAAIAAADVCLNLRYPTAGETSASLLRVMAAGRPAIVSEYAQFAELPDAVAVKVPLALAEAGEEGGDRDEAELLAARLGALLAQPERLRAMGEAAREHVRRFHDPRRAAAAVAAACAEWAAAEPPGDPRAEVAAGGAATGAVAAGAVAAVAAGAAGAAGTTAGRAAAAGEPPPTSLTWCRLAGELEVRGAELPWPEGERRRLEIVLRNHGFARWLAGGRGPGGVAVVVKLIAGGRDLLADRPWLPLPCDLDPGEEVRLELEVRRPTGPPGSPWPPGVERLPLAPDRVRLWIEPHLFGGLGLSQLGGPRWERDI
jgi:glycosyltransferase involved in cell wall biosynthesis